MCVCVSVCLCVCIKPSLRAAGCKKEDWGKKRNGNFFKENNFSQKSAFDFSIFLPWSLGYCYCYLVVTVNSFVDDCKLPDSILTKGANTANLCSVIN